MSERMSLLATVKNEWSTKRSVMLEVQQELEREVLKITQETLEAKDHFAGGIARERQRAQRAQQELEEIHQRGQQLVHEAQNGPVAQISGLQQSVNDTRERHRCIQHQAEIKSEVNYKEVHNMEAELANLQTLLNESERQLQTDSTIMKNVRSENERMLEQLRSESAAVKQKTSTTKEQQSRLLAELDETHRVASSDRARQEKELADLTRTFDQQMRETNSRLETERRRRELELTAGDERLRAEVDRQQHALELADAENRRLRRLVGEVRGQGARGAVDVLAGSLVRAPA